MKKSIKNFLLVVSFVAFLILTPILTLYANGYRFDFGKFKFVKTGGLFLKANLSNAKIFLNDQFIGETSLISNEFAKRNLLPRKYSLKISKEDYASLNKEIEVKPKEVVYLTHLYLIKKGEIEEFISKLNAEKIDKEKKLISKDKKKKLIIKNNEISVLWLEDEDGAPYFKKNHQELIVRLSQNIKEVFWFKTSWHLIYLTESNEIHFVEVDPTGGRNDIKIADF